MFYITFIIACLGRKIQEKPLSDIGLTKLLKNAGQLAGVGVLIWIKI